MLTPSEVERARYHLGYPETVPNAASIQLGIPVLSQTNFLFERAVTLLGTFAEDRVRRTLNIMDGIETRMVSAQARLAANKLGDLELRKEEPEQLEMEYVRWGLRLAGIFGCPVWAYSERYRNYSGGGMPGRSGTIPIRG